LIKGSRNVVFSEGGLLMANFKDVQKVWNDWLFHNNPGGGIYEEGENLVVAIGAAFAWQNGFTNMKDAIGKIANPSEVEFGPEARGLYEKLVDFIDKNSAV